jgi:hypothetical protein
MAPLDYVLAVAVLTAPPGPGEGCPPVQKLAGLAPTVREAALSWELLDPREVGHVLARSEDFDSDVQFLRQRYQRLAGAPPAGDCLRFPTRATIHDLIAFNRAYHRHLSRRRDAGCPCRAEVEAALRETDELYRVWDLLRDARCECYYVTVRRQALLELRDKLGPTAYYSGRLPPHVPVWRFASMD